ncbi:pantetheine-phosphate adenylyltransferase [Pontibacter sp. JH31]|uniref:Phosphopantetheine adenylyltransferase n=1 Tax=Pontibacter aquaedesilientis TaxID=2766980 RepID=A0ABR7XDG8_9BACT|nr:pantetheine-phosphate adenylyltransferase [Pontibacter aquaedesilientis]MBD1396327.1 pantetheine-phosphate adenylyltransferase [Pontibacter aquaedesilientis]
MKKIAIFPGSFDPFTNGHLDVVLRGTRMFDEIVIAIGNNSVKNRYIPVEKMVEIIEEIFKDQHNISVQSYKGLTAEFAHEVGANFLLRGLRNTTDFEYENTIAQANRHINKELETVFLITSPALAAISSTIIREIHRFGGNVDEFIPFPISKIADIPAQ